MEVESLTARAASANGANGRRMSTQTFEVDVPDPEEIRRVLFNQVEQVASRLRKHGLSAHTISLSCPIMTTASATAAMMASGA